MSIIENTAPVAGSGSLSESDRLDDVIQESAGWLAEIQSEDGHWLFELEADATIPAEWIMLNHFLDEIDEERESKLCVYLRRTQGSHGGWPLFHDGEFDMSASVKAYYALKLAGEDIDAPHMVRARDAILSRGGAAKSNVFTRIALALFEQVPWRATPLVRVEALLLPKWAPFHLDKVSYWSRTVMVPLMVLTSLKAKARNPRGIGIPELFTVPPEKVRDWHVNPTGHWIGDLLLHVDTVARLVEPLMPRFLLAKATRRALAFVKERLNGEDGLGGIFPAIANTLMAYQALGYSKDHPDYAIAREAVDKLLVINGDRQGWQ